MLANSGVAQGRGKQVQQRRANIEDLPADIPATMSRRCLQATPAVPPTDELAPSHAIGAAPLEARSGVIGPHGFTPGCVAESILSFHPQRRDAIVAPAVKGLLNKDENEIWKTLPTPARGIAQPWITDPETDRHSCTDTGEVPTTVSLHQRRVIMTLGSRSSLNLTPFVHPFLAGISGDAGIDLTTVISSPAFVVLGGSSRPSFHITPKMEDMNTNGATSFVNVSLGVLVTFLATQQGAVVALIKNLAGDKFEKPLVVFAETDAHDEAGLAEEKYATSMNDLAAVPYAASQYLLFAPKDGDYAFAALIGIERDESSTTGCPYRLRKYFAHHLHLGASGAGLEGLLDRSVKDNTGAEHFRFFTYAAFSEHGDYICATNDNGRYCAVWKTSLRRPLADDADVAAEEDASTAVGLDLELTWVFHMPVAKVADHDTTAQGMTDDNPKSVETRPYKVVNAGGARFVVSVGKVLYVMDAAKREFGTAAMPNRALISDPAAHSVAGDNIIGLSVSVFDRRLVYAATSTYTTSFVLAPDADAVVSWRRSRQSLKSGCLGFLRRHHAEWPSLVNEGLDPAWLLTYCPYGHRLEIFDAPFDVGAPLPGAPNGTAPSLVTCTSCAEAAAQKSNNPPEEATEQDPDAEAEAPPVADVRVVCHHCGFALCSVCASARALRLDQQEAARKQMTTEPVD